MKKPRDYGVKVKLCESSITGVKVHYFPIETDESGTDWEVFFSSGKSRRWRAETVQKLVRFAPDWCRLFEVLPEVRKEVEKWQEFEKKEEHDLAEFQRLKEKFTSTAPGDAATGEEVAA